MSCIVDNSTVLTGVNATTDQSVIIDMSQINRLSVGINVTAFTLGPIITLYESIDGVNFTPVATLTIAVTGLTIWHVDPVFSQFKKILYTANGGSASYTVKINARNDSLNSFGGGVSKIFGTS